MEPFGLFQFLQTLLSPTPSPPSENAENPVQNEKKTTVSEEKMQTEAPKPDNSAQDAYLQFLANHDKHSRRTKKK